MKIQLAQVDAFAEKVFQGNPAAICTLEHWLDESLMQSIATENNLSETAYVVKATGDQYGIRWFTPNGEVDLCGHATLATAHLLFERNQIQGDTVTFQSKSGPLPVRRYEDGQLEMDFPAQEFEHCKTPEALLSGLGVTPVETYRSMDYMAVLKSQQDVIDCSPRLDSLLQLDQRGVIITAPGISCDFVSRFFGPKNGIPEDPVTGSAHCILAPYWANRLNKKIMNAHQISKRGGKLTCEIKDNRVLIKGHAITFMTGEISI